MIVGAALSAFGIQLLENDWFILVLPVTFGGLAIWSWMARLVSRAAPVYPTVFSDVFFIAAMFIFGFVATGVAMIVSTTIVEMYSREDWMYFEFRHHLLVAAIYFPVAVVNGWIALVFDNYRNRQVKQFALGGP